MPAKTRPATERLEGKYIPEPNSGCWLWLGASTAHGYGIMGKGGRRGSSIMAHRASYMAHKGPIPDGLEIDHLCRNRFCINPDHLEAVTRQTNVRRGVIGDLLRAKHAAVTHCVRGHSLTGDNVTLLELDGCVRRRCKACIRERSTNRYHSDLEASRKYHREYKRAQRQ